MLMDKYNLTTNDVKMHNYFSGKNCAQLLKNNLDRCIRIPMLPNARSLNLSNSVAIVLYEMLRQQEYYGLASDEQIKGDTWLEDNF